MNNAHQVPDNKCYATLKLRYGRLSKTINTLEYPHNNL